jgi:REP element-mobilizing transposase RayT
MRPPRISNLLSPEKETMYFITFCVEGRLRVLDNALAWEVICQTLHRLDRWRTLSAVAMPDHLHLITAPRYDRQESVSQFSKWFKRWFNEALPHDWTWQEGCFDRLVRSAHAADEKWDYIRQNPVRAGCVKRPEDWPWQFGFDKPLEHGV